MELNGTVAVPVVEADPSDLPESEPSIEAWLEDFVPDEIPERLNDDDLVNYFRCRFRDRETVHDKLQNDHPRVYRELQRIEKLRQSFEATERNKPEIEVLRYRQAEWRKYATKECDQSLENIDKRIQQMEKLKHGDRARRINIEKRILNVVKSWKPPDLPVPAILEEVSENEEIADNKHPHLSKILQKLEKLRKHNDKPHGPATGSPEKDPVNKSNLEQQSIIPDDSYGITIHQMTLSKSDKNCPTSYMSYESDRPSLKDVLAMGGNSPLRREKHKPGTIRYFHIPANNMYWIEVSQTLTLIEPKFIFYCRKQLHVTIMKRRRENLITGKITIIARNLPTFSADNFGLRCSTEVIMIQYMRDICDLTVRLLHQKLAAHLNKCLTYIGETQRRRKKMAEVMKEESAKHHRHRRVVTETLRGDISQATAELMIRHARQLTGISTLEESEWRKKSASIAKKKSERPPLGAYLLQIAKIYDAMEIEPDVRMLRDYLYKKDSPLHARRTLDQSYYWKLLDTDMRDEDQVVYRETKCGKSIFKTPRVLMVDQLWLYILDDHTIISSFPRRWGRNKPDWSGVHKCIRSHLDHIREGEIQSVYDLALMIMNQCSTVFFDRTKPVDERPEVLDIFSNALSHVSGMKCVSFETFWRQLNKLSSDHQQSDFEATARKYLNINPEGELLRETHDIIEELRMMAHIFSEQLSVAERFSIKLQELYSKESVKESTEEAILRTLREIKTSVEASTQLNRKLVDTKPPSPHETTSVSPIFDAAAYTSDLLPMENESSTLTGITHGALIDPISESVVPNDLNETAPNGSPEGQEHLSPTSTTEQTIPENTLHLAKDLCRDIQIRRQELMKLEENTEYISEQLKDLLDLKQQQASIIEAKYALERADESVTQGRSIMLLTIVTIIFLPLSFMSSVFGMNASDFDSGDSNQSLNNIMAGMNATNLDPKSGESMSLKIMFTYLFPVSLLVILISISLAFSTWIRSGIYAASIIFWAAVLEYSWIRHVWLLLMAKCGVKRTDGKEAGFYRKGAEIKRWIYDRRKRDKMIKDWAIVKQKEKETSGNEIVDRDVKRRNKRTWLRGNEKSIVVGRGTASSDSNYEKGDHLQESIV